MPELTTGQLDVFVAIVEKLAERISRKMGMIEFQLELRGKETLVWQALVEMKEMIERGEISLSDAAVKDKFETLLARFNEMRISQAPKMLAGQRQEPTIKFLDLR